MFQELKEAREGRKEACSGVGESVKGEPCRLVQSQTTPLHWPEKAFKGDGKSVKG